MSGPDPFDHDEVAAIRAATPGCTDGLIHLNHCGSSLPPQTVLDTQVGHLRREAEIGGYEAAVEAQDREAQVYRSIASLIGASPAEIARVEHATAAWNAAFWSIPMAPGQRILTHDHDYGANVIAFLRARDVHGVEVVSVPSDDHGQVDVDRLAGELDRGDAALVSLAWIPTSGGLVNPAAEVGALARSAGVPFLLDACQAVGQLPVDVDEIGCDFLSATGRKFLRGPRGTGFLYARKSTLDWATPSQPDHHGAEWTALGDYEPAADATRFEYWEFSHAGWLGLGAAVDETLRLGQDRIHASIVERAEQLRRGLVEIGMAVHDDGVERCGIVTTTHPRLDSDALRARLTAAGINSSATFIGSARADMEARSLPPMLRLSVHCTTTPAEIDRTLEVLRPL
ncbi:MAG: aminotransferase class V-fold PLP-dependent enzyme [Actinomycetota bacterium]